MRVSQQRDRGALLSRNHALERRSGVVPSDQEVRLFPVSGTLGDWGVHWPDQVLWWTEEKYPKRVFSSAGRPVAGPVNGVLRGLGEWKFNVSEFREFPQKLSDALVKLEGKKRVSEGRFAGAGELNPFKHSTCS